MDVLIDTNVLINFLTKRTDPYLDASIQVLSLCDARKINGWIAFHSLSIIWYVLRKLCSESDARLALDRVCSILTITSATQKQVKKAVSNRDFRDFEDCLQDQCAQNAGAEYIVTCNIKDFRNAETRAVTPKELLEILGY